MCLYVQPRAARTEIAGWHGAELKIRLAASPVDNAANEELIAFMAQRLKVPKCNIRLVRGRTGRRKTLEINGASAAAVATLHSAALPGETSGAQRRDAAPRIRRDEG
jgi:hypothetical protein